jgi:hypothetical protein
LRFSLAPSFLVIIQYTFFKLAYRVVKSDLLTGVGLLSHAKHGRRALHAKTTPHP